MIIDRDKILFAILAGGQSKRFGGGFKTFSKIDGEKILDIIINKLKKYSRDIIINANSLKDFKGINQPIVADKLNGFLGPLAGIHTSMSYAKNKYVKKEWIFTVPSDTPYLPENLLDKFLETFDNQNIKILIARSNNRHHPVIAMWHISLLQNLEDELKSKNYKIMYWVKKHNYKFVEFNSDQEKNFFNINTKEDLSNAKKINIYNSI